MYYICVGPASTEAQEYAADLNTLIERLRDHYAEGAVRDDYGIARAAKRGGVLRVYNFEERVWREMAHG